MFAKQDCYTPKTNDMTNADKVTKWEAKGWKIVNYMSGNGCQATHRKAQSTIVATSLTALFKKLW